MRCSCSCAVCSAWCAAAMRPLTASLWLDAALSASARLACGLAPSSMRPTREEGTLASQARAAASSADREDRKADTADTSGVEERAEGLAVAASLCAVGAGGGPQSACRPQCHARSMQRRRAPSSCASAEAAADVDATGAADDQDDGAATALGVGGVAAWGWAMGGGCPYSRASAPSSSEGRKGVREGADSSADHDRRVEPPSTAASDEPSILPTSRALLSRAAQRRYTVAPQQGRVEVSGGEERGGGACSTTTAAATGKTRGGHWTTAPATEEEGREEGQRAR